jgi:putative spermidine/putrescine transport system substrate-binding protein
LTRDAYRSALALVMAALAVGCDDGSGPEDPAPVTLTFVSYGGAYQQAQTYAWLDSFAAEHPNVTIEQDGPTDYAELAAMVDAGNVSWDLVDVENDFGLDATADLLEPIDCDVVPCDELQPDLLRTTGYRVPVMQFALAVAYRSDAWGGAAPAGWADFFDTVGFPGTRTVRRSGTGSGILEGALIADGVEPADLYPLDVDRALAKLETIIDDIVWWTDGQACAQMLADNEVVMGLCYNGRVYDAQQDGAPVAIQWNEALVQADYLVVPRGSPNVEGAMELIAHMTSAEHNAELSNFISYAPANVNAVDRVPASIAPDLVTTYAEVTIARDDVWLEANHATVEAQFEAWLMDHVGVSTASSGSSHAGM